MRTSLLKIISGIALTANLLIAGNTTTLQFRATDTSIRKPALGGTVLDNVFNTQITRINKHGSKYASYPKVQSWNKNMSLFRIGNRLYDADTLEESAITKNEATESGAYAKLGSRASDYFRWSNIHPDIFYVLNGNYQFIRATITNDTVDCSDVLDAFSDFEVVHMGPYEGNIDYADKYVVFAAKKTDDTKFYLILYDIKSRHRVWTKELTTEHWVLNGSKWEPSTLDWISISPSGKYIVLNNNNGNHDGVYRYDINFENKVKLQYRWDGDGQLYSEDGHGDMGYDTAGHEVYVQFVSGLGIYSFDLDNPTELGCRLTDSPYGGGHISCRNTERPGWCYVSTTQEGYRQVFALKLDGTGEMNVQNFSQSHISDSFYETYGAPGPDGRQVIFNSDWDNDAGVVDVFIAQDQQKVLTGFSCIMR